MNMDKKYRGYGQAISEQMRGTHIEMEGDLCGIWGIIARGKHGYEFRGQDLRDFIHLYVKTLIEAGGCGRWRR